MKTKNKIGGYYPTRKFRQLLKKPTITETVRLNKLQWFGYVERIEENTIPKRAIYEFGNSKIGRTKYITKRNGRK